MAARKKAKRKTLPKDFEAILRSGDLAKMKAVFDDCDLSAYGGYSKQTALAFRECPDDLARWLVAQGADPSATDRRGNTPLHERAWGVRENIAVLLELGADVHSASASIGTPLHSAAAGNGADNARLLIAAGAKVDAKNREGQTPLEVALSRCTGAGLIHLPPLVRVLLDAGATRTPEMKPMVKRIGESFEFHRADYNPEWVDEASAALDFLYEAFDVPPVPRRQVHDGAAPITVKSTTWQEQHDELWKLLVPGSGAAKTVQGEVIRISGRISYEWGVNGGMNWSRDKAEMAHALEGYVRAGAALAPAEIEEIASIVQSLRTSHGGGYKRLMELAVEWVLKNPAPASLAKPKYKL